MHSILAQQTKRIRGCSPTQIKQLIAQSDSEITSIQNKIVALESQIAALVELRDRECAVGAALRSIVAPIRILPVELLAEIFELTISDDLDSSEEQHIRDAFKVSHVCHHWRQIADKTPQLWTGPIHVELYRKRDLKEEGIYSNGLRAWFARSAPLSIPITIGGVEDASRSTESGSRVAEELLRIAFRWRSLRIIDHTTTGSLVRFLAGSRLDSLEELDLWRMNRDGWHFNPATISSFAAASRLRKVTIDTTYGIPIPVQMPSGHPSTARGWSVPPPATLVPVVLEHLHCLSVNWIENKVFAMRLLDCLSAPALHELHLCFEPECQGMEWAEATVTSFQLRSPNITKLKIQGQGLSIPSNALIVALRHTPSLTHLLIEHCPGTIDDGLLQALCYTDNVKPLVPRLHSLALTELRKPFQEDGLASMIASRWWTDVELASRSSPPTVARWTQIELRTVGKRPSRRFWDTLEALRQTGLIVAWEIHTSGPSWYWQ
ncbi:F-box domain-containing protein [Mycena sanguinolenta]|uniref:F-box domain-containing protein n=1 Tax=Mycena sanguinolenta TaxID=230812 RepID=A0A8H6YAI2_9AGAR|nr:F-box domain-containing protein [Mycena sanguinolenta]